MPLPVEALQPTSSSSNIKKAIGDSISQCVEEGKSQDQCIAMVYRMVEKATGRPTANISPYTQGE